MEEQQDLDMRLQCHSACFTTMVELIPSKFYMVKDDTSQIESRYWQNRKQKKPKQAVKEASKKAKKMWLDPAIQKSIQVQKKGESRRPKEDIGEGTLLQNGVDVEGPETVALQSQGNDSRVDGEDLELGDGVRSTLGANSESDGEGPEEGLVNQPRFKGRFSVENVRSGSLSELQERLKARITDFRRKRKAQEPEGQEVRKKEIRLEKKDKKTKKKEIRKRKKQMEVMKQAGKVSRERLPMETSGRGVIFSKIDVSAPTKDRNPVSKKKDYKKLLAKVETKQKTLAEVKEKDESRGEELQEKLNWQKAVDMAKGRKVKDDPKLLKKTVKRLEKKKLSSSKKWEHRTKVEEDIKQKQREIKKKHVHERTKQIKAKKQRKRAKKKGRL